MKAINHYKFETCEKIEIILSEKCHKKLIDEINLCAYHNGIDYVEFGTLLYGVIEAKHNKLTIKFEEPSIFDKEIGSEKWNPSDEMIDEIVEKTLKENAKYNCVAHMHAHPFIDKAGRFFTNKDLKTINTIFKYIDILSENHERNVFKFAGLLTVSPLYTASSDDISFLYFDLDNGKIVNLPNIKVEKDDKIIELPKEYDNIGIDDEQVLFQRTLLGNKSRTIRSKTYKLKK